MRPERSHSGVRESRGKTTTSRGLYRRLGGVDPTIDQVVCSRLLAVGSVPADAGRGAADDGAASLLVEGAFAGAEAVAAEVAAAGDLIGASRDGSLRRWIGQLGADRPAAGRSGSPGRPRPSPPCSGEGPLAGSGSWARAACSVAGSTTGRGSPASVPVSGQVGRPSGGLGLPSPSRGTRPLRSFSCHQRTASRWTGGRVPWSRTASPGYIWRSVLAGANSSRCTVSETLRRWWPFRRAARGRRGRCSIG